MKTEKIIVDQNTNVPFNNNVDYCVGTGRLGLALTEEYLKELKLYIAGSLTTINQDINVRYEPENRFMLRN